MKDRLLTISIREIKKSFKRFLSLLIMSLLGVTVFVGLRNTPGNMLKSLDKYYDETNHYDIRIISTLGLTDSDIDALNKVGTTAYGIHSKDVITNFKTETKVTKIIGINKNINKILLNKGSLPKKDDEIVVENNLLKTEGLKIGDYIEIEEDESLKNSKYKIVGIVTSPIYLFVGGNSITRGNTNIGNGRVEYYIYGNDSIFNMDYYTEIDIAIPNDELTSSDSYVDLVNEKIESIEKIKKQREQIRYDDIIDKYSIEIDEQEEDGKKKLEEAEEQLNSTKQELDRGYQQLISSKEQLDNSKNELDQTRNRLDSSKNELQGKENEFNKKKRELESAEENMNQQLNNFGLTVDDIVLLKNILETKKVSKEKVKQLFCSSRYKNQIEDLIDNNDEFYKNLVDYIENKREELKEQLIESIPNDIENYDEIKEDIVSLSEVAEEDSIYETVLENAQSINDVIAVIPTDINHYMEIMNLLYYYANNHISIDSLLNGVGKIQQGKEEIQKNELLLEQAKGQLEQGYNTYNIYMNLYEEGINKYQTGYKDYQNGLNIYNSGLEEYLKNKLDFENEIEKAREKLKEIEMPEWYIYDRSDDSEYSGFINNTNSVKNLSKAFPTVFFLVAIFMCIMSMSRMALEDRGEIGTLKSLGFSNYHIILKYTLYSMIATIAGSILGGLLGFYFLTWFVFRMYAMLYVIPYFTYQYNVVPFIMGSIIAIICIVGTAIITVRKIVREKPSSLLRPLTPNKGKKMLIENLSLWKKVNFSNKITIRNIVRYRKRVIMTVLGITGCTVLLLTGYGIKDSIVSIPNKQYGEIFIFDDIVYLDHNLKDVKEIIDNKDIKNYEEMNIQTVTVNGITTNLFALKDNWNHDVINLTDYKTNEKLEFEDHKVIITDKLSTIYDFKVGDKIEVFDADNKNYTLEISAITTNYVGSYIYMNIDYYEELFGEYIPNVVYFNLKDVNQEDEVVKELMENEHVLSIVTKTTSLHNIDVMLRSLNYVVLILIVLSGALSFVVLYNLSYINISERKREIATLKVLGFTPHEVDNYIIKENFIITIIGILFGLILSKPFVNYIVDTIEIELVSFIHIINPTSYIYTFMFMIIFTCVVTFIIHFALKKIDMIESLKTVE